MSEADVSTAPILVNQSLAPSDAVSDEKNPPTTSTTPSIPPPKIPRSRPALATLNHLIKRLTALLATHSKRDNLLCLAAYTILLTSSFRPDKPQIRTLYNFISDYRIFARMLAMPGMYTWLLSTLESPPKDPVLRAVAFGEVGSCIIYQGLENIAWLGSKEIVQYRGGAKTVMKAWLWSSRFWAAYVALELVRLVREWQLGERTDEVGRGQWWRDVGSNFAWAPLTVHWSTEKGVISDRLVGLFGVIAGGISFERAWKSTKI